MFLKEQHFRANTVEVAACSKCGHQTRFPRKVLRYHEFWVLTCGPCSRSLVLAGYNDPAKLLQTRTGRCGEWANCFTLVCRSLGHSDRIDAFRIGFEGQLFPEQFGRPARGYEARHVHDWTDHVWTEIFSESNRRRELDGVQGSALQMPCRWVHVDSCEAALDSPLMYELLGARG